MTDEREITIWHPPYEKVLARVNELRSMRPSHADLLTLYEVLLRHRWECFEHIAPPDPQAGTNCGDDVVAVLNREDFLYDVPGVRAFFGVLAEQLRKVNDRLSEEIPKFQKSLEDQAIDFGNLLKRVVAEDHEALSRLANDSQVGVDVVYLLLYQALRPYVEKHARQVARQLKQVSKTRRDCPVCGSAPIIAQLREDEGERWLFCSFCGTDWRFLRLDCPHCGNSDQDTMQFLYFDRPEEKENTIGLCDMCKGYIKTIDCRKTARNLVPDLEDVASLHLDVIAEEDGYEGPHSPYTPFA